MKEYIPAPHLRRYIHRYWIIANPDPMLPEKCVMDGYVKMFFYLNDNLPVYYDDKGRKKEWGNGFGGHQTGRDLLISTPADLHLVFCIFKPLGFYHLFRTPVPLLNNTVAPLEAFLGSRYAEFRERVLGASGDPERVLVLNDFFTSLTCSLPSERPSGLDYIQDRMLQMNGLVSIDRLSREVNISCRSLERHFSKKLGMSPKYYTRILRFNHAFSLRRANPDLDWFDIIFDCGFFDQTHFIKDFAHFTGESPGVFYKRSHPIKAIYVGRK